MSDRYLSVLDAIELLRSLTIPLPALKAATDSDLKELARLADAVDVIYTAVIDELDSRPENDEIPETLAP